MHYSKRRFLMKKATFTLIAISILFLFFYGCGGSSGGSSNSESRVADENLQPIADAGDDQTVFVGDTASLDGSGSYDPDQNYPLTFEWQVVSEPEQSAAILSADGSQASIEPDVNGDYVIQLVVTDSLGLASEPEFVVVSTQNSAPVADAGDDQYFENPDIIIELDGSQSFDPDGDPIT